MQQGKCMFSSTHRFPFPIYFGQDWIVTFKKSLTHFEFLRMIILFYSHKMIFFNNLLEIPKKRFPSKNIEVID